MPTHDAKDSLNPSVLSKNNIPNPQQTERAPEGGGKPPSYNEAFTEGFVQTTTTTTTTKTTKTTTSFFPLLRRKGSNAPLAQLAAMSEHSVTGSSLAVNKSLPPTPDGSPKPTEMLNLKEKRKANKTSSRPQTADGLPERRDSLVALSIPLTLAHAAPLGGVGIRVPLTPPANLLLSQYSMDPVERKAGSTPRPPSPAAKDKMRHNRRSLSVSVADEMESIADNFSSSPEIRLGGNVDHTHSHSLSLDSPLSIGNFWSLNAAASSPRASEEAKRPRKSQTLQTLPLPQQGKSITRRASWWGKEKDSPPYTSNPSSLQSPIQREIKHALAGLTGGGGKSRKRAISQVKLEKTPKAASTQLPPSPLSESATDLSGRLTVDLSHSPPPGEMEQIRVSQSAPLSPTIPGYESPSSPNSSGNLRPPEPQLQRTSSNSSRRPRSLSLFLKPTAPSPDSNLASQSPASPLAPNSSVAHARPKMGTTPPLLRRFSSTLFNHSGRSPYDTPRTPGSSLSQFTQEQTHEPIEEKKKSISIPVVEKEETPEGYLGRLMEAVSKSEVAGVLANRGDEFHASALRAYLRKFNFTNDPLDIAVRRLLMHVALPRETQQIDRVMDAFAARWGECNDGLFVQQDHAYILAFSLIMLHTDAFNKSNKNKMTKAAYVKNTRLPGVQPEVLEYFYDNILFAPFIFIEDPLDISGQKGYASPNSIPTPSTTASSTSIFLSRSTKIDPYYLIISDLLDPLRLQLESTIPKESPYHYLGTAESWNHEELRQAFAEAAMVTLGDKEMPKRLENTNFSGFTSTPPSLIPMALGTGGMSPGAFNDVWSFKLTKIGVINRKEDVLDGGKRAPGRKWRQFKVALTGSQLLFFKDLKWDQMLIEKGVNGAAGTGREMVPPTASLVKPDEVLSVNDAIALYDISYTKYPNAFRLILSTGRQYLLQVLDEHELNEWIARINYASAFRTAGIRMRTTTLKGRDAELLGVAAANSHVRETMLWQAQASPQVHNYTAPESGLSFDKEVIESIGVGVDDLTPRTKQLSVSKSSTTLDLEHTEETVRGGAEQLKTAFEDVKAELAKSPSISQRLLAKGEEYASTLSDRMPLKESEKLNPRGAAIQFKISELEEREASIHAQLDADLRTARNLAILTPFQQSTRARLEEHIPPLARRIKLARLQLAKCECHLEVLRMDLEGDEQERAGLVKAGLKVATGILKKRLGENASIPAAPILNDALQKSKNYPAASSSRPLIPARHPSRRQGSFASSSSSTHEGSLPTPMGHSSTNDTVSNTLRPLVSPLSAMSTEQDAPVLDEPSSTIDHSSGVEGPLQEEQAEEWNKTRAAKRVSLVKVHRQSLKPLATKLHLDEEAEPSFMETNKVNLSAEHSRGKEEE